MTDLIRTVLIEDSRIAGMSPEETFGVQSFAQQSTYQQFQATSASNSSIVFNIQVPSENIVIDRHLLMQSTIQFTVNLGGGLTPFTLNQIGSPPPFQYGLTDSLQAFPLQSLMTTIQATINNTSTSTNLQDILPMVTRMYDRRVLSRYNSMTPSLCDALTANYSDGYGSLGNPLGSYNNQTVDEDFTPRGSYPVNFLGYTCNVNGVAYTLSTATPLRNIALITDTYALYFSVNVTEPFLALSPFINCQPSNQAGLIGINNISMVANIDSSCKRFFSGSKFVSSVALGVISGTSSGTTAGFLNPRLLFNFLSLTPEQYAKVSTRNVVPYLEYPRYISNANGAQTVPALNASTVSLTSASIQLNQIPDLILICARKPMSAQTVQDTSSFLTISGMNISFNNASGLLASCTTQDLYGISIANGSSQSWYEFSGSAGSNAVYGNINNNTGVSLPVATTGSLMVLNPSRDFSLPSYLTASSLGQYQLLVQMQVSNQFSVPIVPEIVIVTVNSGIFSTVQGTSSIFTGVLSKETVLRTKEQNPVPEIDTQEFERLVGGRLGNRGMSNIGSLLKHHLKKRLHAAVVGAGSSGGASSGGVKHHKLHKHV